MTDPVAPEAARISRIEVADFRAYPKSDPGKFDLGDGCNLLAFGENGAGKSSLYRALRDLFSTTPPAITDMHNVFSDLPAPSVRVTLTDGAAFTWTSVGHPGAAIVDIARRSAFLTHTKLRELLYNPGRSSEPLDLFDIAITDLIGDFDATLDGGLRRSVRELWDDVTQAFEARVPSASGTPRRPQNYIRKVEAACTQFNDGMRQALDALDVRAEALLRQLLDALSPDPMTFVGFVFTPIRYEEAARKIDRQPLIATVKVKAHQPSAPQQFLNEARQTALALAIYLAARLVCVPPGRHALKLLVMDDLLISLDATHRRPVLALILELFKDWQIILLTHDRYWFQLARQQLSGRTDWKTIEIYERFNGDGLLTPLVRPIEGDMVASSLAQAKKFLDDDYPAAACNYARSACELVVKRFCIKQHVSFPYFEDDSPPSLNALLDSAIAHVANDPPRLRALQALHPYRKFVLNPLSHDPAHPIPKADVAAAIEAVREVARACGRAYP
jgi:energy-coupling factor transporter ATP-binding protein EcfA2